MNRSLFLIVPALLAASVAAQAETVTVNVPFDFCVNKVEHTAGPYSLTLGSSSVFQLRKADGQGPQLSSSPLTLTSNKAKRPHLTFVMRDGRYYLSEIWDSAMAGHGGISVPKPARRSDEVAYVYFDAHNTH